MDVGHLLNETLDTDRFPNHEELSSVIWCNFAERSRMSCWILFKSSVGSINPMQHSGPIMVQAPPCVAKM